MPAKLATSEFRAKARAVHGNRYDYSLVEYRHSGTPVTIICRTHGPFLQSPHSHLGQRGCPKCGDIQRTNSQRKSLKKFLDDARGIHGNRYDYSLVEYRHSGTPVTIICRTHGPFLQRPHSHLGQRRVGCPKCGVIQQANSQRKSLKKFLDDARGIHGNRYDYSLVEYRNSETPVTIICRTHGPFLQRPHSHLGQRRVGCPKCGVIQQANSRRKPLKKFLDDARGIHGDRYDYSLVEYRHSKTPVTIICRTHGPFLQSPLSHIGQRRRGCPKCGKIQAAETRRRRAIAHRQLRLILGIKAFMEYDLPELEEKLKITL